MTLPVPEDLRLAAHAFARPDALSFNRGRRAPQGGRRAAVLILLSQADAGGYEIVLVEKRADLRSHAGQIAFPGGSYEPQDSTPVETALREAQEEVGILPASVEVLGLLPVAHVPRSGFDVTSVVGWWSAALPLAVTDPAELTAVHQVPVLDLVNPDNRSTWTLPGGYTGPAFGLGELYVWGFTAHLLDGLFDLLGWTRPWDASRITEIPPRFFQGR